MILDILKIVLKCILVGLWTVALAASVISFYGMLTMLTSANKVGSLILGVFYLVAGVYLVRSSWKFVVGKE